MNFSYHNPVKISFGEDYLQAARDIAKHHQNLLLVSSAGFERRGVLEKLKNALGDALKCLVSDITPNPQLQDLINIKQNLPPFSAIIALGGGSVIDSAKFFSVCGDICASNGKLEIKPSADSMGFRAYQPSADCGAVNNPANADSSDSASFSGANPAPCEKSSLDSKLESKQNLRKDSIITKPIFAIPTTAGTGSELTQWATIWDKTNHIKYSLNSAYLYPKMAIYDVNLTYSLPRQTTINTALDALSHAIESIWNKNANPISTHFALRAIEMITRDLPRLCEMLIKERGIENADFGNDDLFFTHPLTPSARDGEQDATNADSSDSPRKKPTQRATANANSSILDESADSQNATRGRICDEKSGFSSTGQGNYLVGNDRSRVRRIADFSRKANAPQEPTQSAEIFALRERLMKASMFAALAFSNTQTALAHAISYPLSMRFGVPHGLACSFSLPLLLENLPDSNAKDILEPFKPRIIELFNALDISTNPRDYGIDSAFLEEIFASLNERAKNSIFNLNRVKEAFLRALES